MKPDPDNVICWPAVPLPGESAERTSPEVAFDRGGGKRRSRKRRRGANGGPWRAGAGIRRIGGSLGYQLRRVGAFCDRQAGRSEHGGGDQGDRGEASR